MGLRGRQKYGLGISEFGDGKLKYGVRQSSTDSLKLKADKASCFCAKLE